MFCVVRSVVSHGRVLFLAPPGLLYVLDMLCSFNRHTCYMYWTCGVCSQVTHFMSGGKMLFSRTSQRVRVVCFFHFCILQDSLLFEWLAVMKSFQFLSVLLFNRFADASSFQLVSLHSKCSCMTWAASFSPTKT